MSVVVPVWVVGTEEVGGVVEVSTPNVPVKRTLNRLAEVFMTVRSDL